MDEHIQTVTITALFIGIIATATLDLWVMVLKQVIGLTPTNWAMVGRWVGNLSRGELRHRDIQKARAVPHELWVGWSTHYLVGIGYALGYLLLGQALAIQVSLLTAVAFGIVTVLAPWLILQPGLGMGYFAFGAPNPRRTRVINIMNHAVFGAALYLGWCLYVL